MRGFLEKAGGEEIVRRETGRYAARQSFEEIFEGEEADEGIYEVFTRNESI